MTGNRYTNNALSSSSDGMMDVNCRANRLQVFRSRFFGVLNKNKRQMNGAGTRRRFEVPRNISSSGHHAEHRLVMDWLRIQRTSLGLYTPSMAHFVGGKSNFSSRSGE
jgi:hypothetical protein